MRRSSRGLILAALAATTVLLTACGTPAGSPRVELTIWAWADLDAAVELWNAQHPDVQVEVSTPAQGDPLVTRLITANRAHQMPDLAQVEYQNLPSLVVAGAVADLTESLAPVRDGFDPTALAQVEFDGRLYAVPQDVAPMMLFYRADLFAELGLSVPRTWDEFRAVGEQVRAIDPDRYLTTFSATDPGWFAGLAQQAGAQWWRLDERGWQVRIDDEATRRVATYWDELVDADIVQAQPMYTPQWNTQLNDGTLLAWPSATWGPGVLEGVAPDTRGRWAMAPLPQWEPGAQATGTWGGSTTVVGQSSDHVAEAAEFARWLNTDPEALRALVGASGMYPATTAGRSELAAYGPPDFLPNQPDFAATATQIAGTVRQITRGPNTTVAYTAYEDAFGAAVQSGGSFVEAIERMQRVTFQDMARVGFTVTEGSRSR